jgi:hypothetical protein
MLVKGDLHAANAAASELSQIAATIDSVFVRALADRADASVQLAEGRPSAAVAGLRRSSRAWQEVDAPYEAARVRVLLGEACRALGDEQSALMEFDAARWVFERLGAKSDLMQLDGSSAPASPAGGLTA